VRTLPLLALVLLWPAAASATDYPADPTTYRNLLNGLQPGDRLLLAAGTYEGLPVSDLNGTAPSPIVISGPASGARAIIGGRSCCNTISITDSSYVVLQHLDVDNRGEEVDGLKAEGNSQFAHHITLEDLHIYNFGVDQQLVGISTKCPAWDWIIRGNLIEAAGTGLYLGDSTGDAPFVRGIVEQNLVVDPLGYDMQIKHQNPRPNLPGLPTGDSVTIIRHNVFVKANRAATGADARPNLLVGHWPPSGPGQNDRYEIYGNFFYQNATGGEGLFQGEGHVAFHDNVLVNSFGPGVYIQPQNDAVKNIQIYNNTVYVSGEGIAIFGADQAYTQEIVGNAVFAGTPLQGGDQRDNVTAAFNQAGTYVNTPGTNPGNMDFYPRPGGGLEGGAIDLSGFGAHQEWDRDFNGASKTQNYRGAYSGSGTNPGWALAVDFKGLGAVPPPVDAGFPDQGFVDGGFVDDGAEADAAPIDVGFDDAGQPADVGFPADLGFDDAGRPVDAGVRADSGNSGPADPDPNAELSGGCGCRTSDADPQSPAWAILGFALFIRRRR
jgi:MYXO-CTERM domain-containing protein